MAKTKGEGGGSSQLANASFMGARSTMPKPKAKPGRPLRRNVTTTFGTAKDAKRGTVSGSIKSVSTGRKRK